MKTIRIYDLYWSPTGEKIGTVEASTAKLAKRKAPARYRKYKGEIYVELRGDRPSVNLYDRAKNPPRRKADAVKPYQSAAGHYYILGGVSYGPFRTIAARNADRRARTARKPRRKNRARKPYHSPKRTLMNRKVRRAVKTSGRNAKAAYHAQRSRARYLKRTPVKNPAAAPRKAKTGRWYKGPRGVKVRVRRVKGKFVVDVKK